jgi:hypothetical protein
MKELLDEHLTPALRSSKGMGPIFQATSLAWYMATLSAVRREPG